jgi:Cd2+/Zn2+-exporting ATPase
VSGPTILHETATRLRLQPGAGRDLDALAARLRALAGVEAVRANRRLGCVTVHHDGRGATRAAVLKTVRMPVPAAATRAKRPRRDESGDALGWTPGVLAAAVPLLPADWRAGGALGVVATRALTQRRRLKTDASAVLLDAASLASLAISGQPLVVSASVLLRLLSEGLSGRLVRQADRLLEHLLPTAADEYRVLGDDGGRERWWPLRRVRAGDRLRLYPGDVVPVDGCIAEGRATLHPVAQADVPRALSTGAHVSAGERVLAGTFELLAESDASGSRLERLRGQVEHAIGARDPAGRLAPELQRLVALPLTGAALVFGLTGDTSRAAAMLQADPQQGLDIALPVAREAALYSLARHGLVTSGLETVERLASARTLVLQDTSVLAEDRWTVALVDTEAGGDDTRVRAWLAALAGVTEPALATGGVPDALVRQWVRHGAVLRIGAHDLHLASARRLQRIWGLALADPCAALPDAAVAPAGLRRVFGVVADGRVVARVVLASAWRKEASERLERLHALGFERIAVFAEDNGSECPSRASSAHWPGRPGVECLPDDALARADWLADAVHDGAPLVLVHTVLRDLVPPGSISLTPAQADIGAHGVLLGDPLAGLETARRLARIVHRRLRLQQNAAVGVNAALMTAAALRWLPPIATALLHHGFAVLVLLDSLRIEALDAATQRQGTAPATESSTITPRATTQRAREPRSHIA